MYMKLWIKVKLVALIELEMLQQYRESKNILIELIYYFSNLEIWFYCFLIMKLWQTNLEYEHNYDISSL